MEISIFLAKVIGVYFVIASVLVLTTQNQLVTFMPQFRSKTNFLVLGFVVTLIGLLMIISHNVWTTSHQIAISLVGWISFIKGLIILFFPMKVFNQLIDLVNKPIIYNIFGIVALLLGLWLSYFGFVVQM